MLSYRLGFNTETFVPADGLKNLSGPLLMVAASEDVYVPLSEIMTFYRYVPEPKKCGSSRGCRTGIILIPFQKNIRNGF